MRLLNFLAMLSLWLCVTIVFAFSVIPLALWIVYLAWWAMKPRTSPFQPKENEV